MTVINQLTAGLGVSATCRRIFGYFLYVTLNVKKKKRCSHAGPFLIRLYQFFSNYYLNCLTL